MMSHPVSREFQCIICGSSSAQRLYPVRDTNQGVHGQWDIVQCDGCGLGVLWPLPSPDEISFFYEGQFYTEGGERFAGPVEQLRAKLAELRGRTLDRICPDQGRLMDFGSGAGHFVRAQQLKGWEVHSVDPYSSVASHSARVSTNKDGTVLLDYPDAYFDAISLWYVLEHLANPQQVLRELGRVLKPGGYLLIAVQDFSSVQARFFGPRWLILDPPRHLWHFSPANLDMLAKRHGLRRTAMSRACVEMGPFTILQSTLNILLGNRNHLFRFLKNPRLSRGRVSWTEAGGVAASIALSTVLGPLSFLAYWGLLAIGSGDVFTAYYRKDAQ